jgi:transposase
VYVGFILYFYTVNEANNISELALEIELLAKENGLLCASLSEKDEAILKLESQLKQLRRALFGRKSERFVPEDPNQLRLDFDLGEVVPVSAEIDKTATTDLKKKTRTVQSNVRMAIPAHLPRVPEVIEPENLPQGSKKIGEVITEVLEITPAQIYVRQIIRPKYALPNEGGIVIGHLPSLPFFRSNAGASLLAWLIVNKYVNHLPFYRQVQMLQRDKVELAESTINDWFKASADLLEPLYHEIWRQMKNTNHLFADESTIPVLNVDKPGGTVKGYHWILRGIDPNLVFFYYNQGSRGYHIIHEMLPGFQGAVQCDGYGAYDQLDNIKGIMTIGCWAHARRKFEQALGNDSELATYALLKIKELYAIERKASAGNFSHNQIKELRQKESFPILKEFETWLLEKIPTTPPKSPIGQAIHYTYGMYRKLIRYTLDGRYRIDNNLAENGVRPLALGRKNYLFCGNHQAAVRTAIIYSLMGSCKINNVNPQEWLTDVLSRIQDHNSQKLDELLPNKWKLNRS